MRWGRASIPELCVLFNVAGGRIQLCGLLSRCWMVDSDFFFFFFCLSVFREWMGRACGVVVRKFVFRIVDGTGIFSVSS